MCLQGLLAGQSSAAALGGKQRSPSFLWAWPKDTDTNQIAHCSPTPPPPQGHWAGRLSPGGTSSSVCQPVPLGRQPNSKRTEGDTRVPLRHHRHQFAQFVAPGTCDLRHVADGKSEDCNSVPRELCSVAFGTVSPSSELIYAAGGSSEVPSSVPGLITPLSSAAWPSAPPVLPAISSTRPTTCPRFLRRANENASPFHAAQWSIGKEDANIIHHLHHSRPSRRGNWLFSLQQLRTSFRRPSGRNDDTEGSRFGLLVGTVVRFAFRVAR